MPRFGVWLGHRAVEGAFGAELHLGPGGRGAEQCAACGHLEAIASRGGQQVRLSLYWFSALDVERDDVIVTQLRMRLASDNRPDKLGQILDGLRHRSPRLVLHIH